MSYSVSNYKSVVPITKAILYCIALSRNQSKCSGGILLPANRACPVCGPSQNSVKNSMHGVWMLICFWVNSPCWLDDFCELNNSLQLKHPWMQTEAIESVAYDITEREILCVCVDSFAGSGPNGVKDILKWRTFLRRHTVSSLGDLNTEEIELSDETGGE